MGMSSLPDGRVGGQAPAQAARVQDELAALPEPTDERLARSGCAPGLGQEIGRAAARAERLAGGIGGGEPIGLPPAFQRFELGHHARWKGQQVLNRDFGAWHSSGADDGKERLALSREIAKDHATTGKAIPYKACP